MTLYKLLSEMDNDKKIKIGAVDGSSYFYVGTVGDILDNFSYYSDRLRRKPIKEQT